MTMSGHRQDPVPSMLLFWWMPLAASPRSKHTLLVKQMIRVSHSSSAASAPPAWQGASKRQKTTVAHKDLCCFCSIGGSCITHNCLCTKTGWPCHSCNSGSCNHCSNTLEAHNWTITANNYCRSRGIAAQFQVRVGRELEPQIPLVYNVGSPLVDDNDEDKLGLVNNNPS